MRRSRATSDVCEDGGCLCKADLEAVVKDRDINVALVS